jgi:hypothetical protein
MDQKILMWIISGLLAIIAFFLQDIWRDVKALKKDIKERTLIIDCEKMHESVDLYLHKHAKTGQAGEVVDIK